MSDMCRLIAVYGTLRPGFHNNWLLDGARYLGEGRTEFFGTLHSCGGFPILSSTYPTQKVKVDIFELPEGVEGERMMQRLDMLEGYPEWYDRKVRCMSINGEEIYAWIYTQEGTFPDLPQVESGDWKQFKGVA